jgi:hypothetical protein
VRACLELNVRPGTDSPEWNIINAAVFAKQIKV